MGRIVLRGLGFIYCWGEGHVDRLLGMVGYSWFKRIGYLVVVGGSLVVAWLYRTESEEHK